METVKQAVTNPVPVIIDVVKDPVPVIVGATIGGVVAGPVGTALGTVVGTGEAVGNEAERVALREYVDRMNQAIADVQAAKPDYDALQVIWVRINAETFQVAWKDAYGDACPPPEVLAPLIAIDVEKRHKSLSPEAFRQELDNIHNGSVVASTAQLTHERDDPENQEKPAGVGDQFAKFFGQLVTELGRWLKDRFQSNFDGVSNESGIGARILRGTSGISWEDIKAHGLLGGENSYLRKIIPTWSDNGGVFGGPNSFFRKPFG